MVSWFVQWTSNLSLKFTNEESKQIEEEFRNPRQPFFSLTNGLRLKFSSMKAEINFLLDVPPGMKQQLLDASQIIPEKAFVVIRRICPDDCLVWKGKLFSCPVSLFPPGFLTNLLEYCANVFNVRVCQDEETKSCLNLYLVGLLVDEALGFIQTKLSQFSPPQDWNWTVPTNNQVSNICGYSSIMFVNSFSDEFKLISNKIRADGLSEGKLLCIQRIQNQHQFSAYCNEAFVSESTFLKPRNEVLMYHGSRSNLQFLLSPLGLDVNRAKPSNLWGRGIYLSSSSAYSIRYSNNLFGKSVPQYSSEIDNELLAIPKTTSNNQILFTKQIIICSVQLGNIYYGGPSTAASSFINLTSGPDMKNSSLYRLCAISTVCPKIMNTTDNSSCTYEGQTYDSVVGKLAGDAICACVYSNARVYPRYIVTLQFTDAELARISAQFSSSLQSASFSGSSSSSLSTSLSVPSSSSSSSGTLGFSGYSWATFFNSPAVASGHIAPASGSSGHTTTPIVAGFIRPPSVLPTLSGISSSRIVAPPPPPLRIAPAPLPSSIDFGSYEQVSVKVPL